jgi:beta-lactamase class A
LDLLGFWLKSVGRTGAYWGMVVVAAMALPTALRGQGAADRAALMERVGAIAKAHHGDVALYAENLRTHETVGLNPDQVVQTASVIKLAILYEAMEQVRSGKAHWDDKVTLTKADQVPGSGVLRLMDAPLPLTLKDVLTMMVVLSDNSATNLAIDHLGLEAIDGRIAKLGLKNTYLYKKVFTPVAAGVTLPADFKQFGLGKTTPREMAELMGKIARCELGDPALAGDKAICEVALAMLRLQFYRSSIPRYLDGMAGATSDSILNKTGSLDAVRNDVAAVSTANGLVILSAFTYNNKDKSWGAEHEAELTIAKIAREIVTAWAPKGLAGWPSAGH